MTLALAEVRRICFVCTGNICRSPMAAVVTQHLAQRARLGLEITSAGTGAWHEGEPMDPRASRALHDGGYRDFSHTAHQFKVRWFEDLDLVVGLDRRHLTTLQSMAGKPRRDKVVLMRTFDPAVHAALDVPDPYYGDQSEFASCLALIEPACAGLVDQLVAARAG